MTASMRFIFLALVSTLWMLAPAQDGRAQEDPDPDEAREWVETFAASLEYQSGHVELESAGVALDLDSSFAFLDAANARRLLEEAWGNPPEPRILGAIVSADFQPFDDETWAVIVQYHEDGHVPEEDAGEMDDDALLRAMQEEASASNEARRAQGHVAIDQIRWADPPRYDTTSHELSWAHEIAFEEAATNTLSYNVRALGRRGVLALNAVGSMRQVSQIRSSMQELLPRIVFLEGHRYQDFDPSTDEVARYGIAALVSGRPVQGTGWLAALSSLIVGLRRFGVVVLVAIGALAAYLLLGHKLAPRLHGTRDETPRLP